MIEFERMVKVAHTVQLNFKKCCCYSDIKQLPN